MKNGIPKEHWHSISSFWLKLNVRHGSANAAIGTDERFQQDFINPTFLFYSALHHGAEVFLYDNRIVELEERFQQSHCGMFPGAGPKQGFKVSFFLFHAKKVFVFCYFLKLSYYHYSYMFLAGSVTKSLSLASLEKSGLKNFIKCSENFQDEI